jgi:hypothetical protein
MRLQQEPPSRCLNPQLLAHSTSLFCILCLVLAGTEVFDNRVREADVEGLVGILYVRSISFNKTIFSLDSLMSYGTRTFSNVI